MIGKERWGNEYEAKRQVPGKENTLWNAGVRLCPVFAAFGKGAGLFQVGF